MKVSTVLGVIGGIFGIIGGLFAVGFGSAFDAESTIAAQGWIAIGASVLAIFASAQVKEKPKMWGWILITSGIAGLIAISFFYILPAILLALAGILALRKN